MPRVGSLAVVAAVCAAASVIEPSLAATSGATFSVEPEAPKVFGRRANVSVTWEVPCNLADTIWVGAWSPIDFDLPVKAFNLTNKTSARSPSVANDSCTGVTVFELLNIRHPFQFRLTNGTGPGDSSSQVATLAVSNVSVIPDRLPMQIFTSALTVPGMLQVKWVDNETDVLAGVPVVRYGYNPTSLSSTASGNSTTYSKADLAQCLTKDTTATRRFIDPGMLNTVVLQGLEPGKPLYFQVGRQASEEAITGSRNMGIGIKRTNTIGMDLSSTRTDPVWSDIISHSGALPTPAATGRVKVMYLADVGAGPARQEDLFGALDAFGGAIMRENAGPRSGGRLVVEQGILPFVEQARAANDPFQLVLHNGDISYACGEGWIHEEFGTMIEPLASRLPYMVTAGNHEVDHGNDKLPGWNRAYSWCEEWGCAGYLGEDSGGDCGLPYRKRFAMPEGLSAGEAGMVGQLPAQVGQDPMAGFKPYYSFEAGPIHFAILSVEADFTNSSSQSKWLISDLEMVNRSNTPWVVVLHHRQIFMGTKTTDPVQLQMQRHLEWIYLENKVDLVVAAHEHLYMRMCPQAHGVCVPGETGTVKAGSAPVYVIDGTGGAYTGYAATGEGYWCEQPLPPFSDETILAQDCTWGFSELEGNETHLQWTHHRWGVGANVTDQVTIVR